MSGQDGFLLIGSDVELARETDYLHWLAREHAAERLAIPGFDRVRVFRRDAGAAAQFLILYRLASAEIAKSPAYLARLETPTEWSQRIMPQLKNFLRGAGTFRAESGSGEGVFAASVVFEARQIAGFAEAAREIVRADRIVAARILETDAAATAMPTKEKSLRTGDRSFSAMLLIEALDEAALAPIAMLAEAASEPPRIYRQIFALDRPPDPAIHPSR
jgi:hypothetical protein